jgi:hypothetical protein
MKRAVALLVLAGCASTEAARQRAAERAYLAEHLRCVQAYDTEAEVNRCRADVRSRWGITETVTKDAGR